MTTNHSSQQRLNPLFVFSGGGSGGHLFPAVAVCEELVAHFGGHCSFEFFTSGRAIENTVLSQFGYSTIPFTSVTGSELRRRPFVGATTLLRTVTRARRYLKQSKPAVVVGLGGFGSLPGVLAAKSLGIPILLMEQNSVAGNANEFLARFAKVICVTSMDSFQGKTALKKLVLTGNPVRRSIREVDGPLETTYQPTLTILGGSQGAAAINDAIIQIATKSPDLFRNWKVLHQTGQEDNSQYCEAYRTAGVEAEVQQFFSDMASVYRRSTLVISRAGATTLAELATLRLPAILVPYPNSLKDHQVKNAEDFVKRHGAKIVEQRGDSASFESDLLQALRPLLTDRGALDKFTDASYESEGSNAARKVADEILKISNITGA